MKSKSPFPPPYEHALLIYKWRPTFLDQKCCMYLGTQMDSRLILLHLQEEVKERASQADANNSGK